MIDKTEALNILRKAVTNPNAQFKQGQWEAVDALVNKNKRLLVVERTGWGKSLVYFIATHILRQRGKGLTLIISPLLALMRNQIAAAQNLNLKPLTINSTNESEWEAHKNALLANEADVLFISPERLANDDFVAEVLLPIASRIGLLVIDEAHCISDWGHDFRPDYQRITNVLNQMPENVLILGTTATANNRVRHDIKDQLGNVHIQRGSLMRESLALQTIRLRSQAERLAWLAQHVNDLKGTGIIYALTIRDVEQVARWLQSRNISAHAYHGSTLDRPELEQQLLDNKIKVLVATTALGMGYDKPDLNFVIHYQAPGSIIAYYQQVGRAGRAIELEMNRKQSANEPVEHAEPAYGILMTGEEDNEIHEHFRKTAFPSEKQVRQILTALESGNGLTIRELEKMVNLRYTQIDQALKFLSVQSHAPVIKQEGLWRRTAVEYRMDHDKIQRLTQQRENEWQEIQTYIDTKECLMMFLAKSLDDADPQPCGKCTICLGKPLIQTDPSRELAIDAQRFLRHAEFPLACKIQVPQNAFKEYGFNGNLPTNMRAEIGRTFSRWGDAGWGQVVADDKHSGHFRDELVSVVAEMISQRWQPSPPPKWVTCVPSKNHPDLVPDYAKRLAEALGLPFKPVVIKTKDNEPQKMQQNRFHQCQNLDGAFAIEKAHVIESPVLLVDDVVDSGWTLTIIAALLREAGSGAVFPLALTTSNMAS